MNKRSPNVVNYDKEVKRMVRDKNQTEKKAKSLFVAKTELGVHEAAKLDDLIAKGLDSIYIHSPQLLKKDVRIGVI